MKPLMYVYNEYYVGLLIWKGQEVFSILYNLDENNKRYIYVLLVHCLLITLVNFEWMLTLDDVVVEDKVTQLGDSHTYLVDDVGVDK